MAKHRSTVGKRQREREKQEKAKAKLEKRAARAEQAEERPSRPEVDASAQAGALASFAELHDAYEDGRISMEDFELRRDELRSALQVD